jgi:hypothetical protein
MDPIRNYNREAIDCFKPANVGRLKGRNKVCVCPCGSVANKKGF